MFFVEYNFSLLSIFSRIKEEFSKQGIIDQFIKGFSKLAVRCATKMNIFSDKIFEKIILFKPKYSMNFLLLNPSKFVVYQSILNMSSDQYGQQLKSLISTSYIGNIPFVFLTKTKYHPLSLSSCE